MHAVEPCILDSSPWNETLIESYPGSNHDFLKDQHALWPRLVRLPRLIFDVIEYSLFSGTGDETNRTLQHRAQELLCNLDLSDLRRSSLESLQLEMHDSNAGNTINAYGVMAATTYMILLTATITLIQRLIGFWI